MCRIGTRIVAIVSCIVLRHILVLCLIVVSIIVVVVNGRGGNGGGGCIMLRDLDGRNQR